MTFIFHFCRCFGPKCGGCGEKIHYQDFVRKARDKVYHLRCFTCSLCSKQLSTGEVLYLQPGDEGFVCKDHYLKQGKKGKILHGNILGGLDLTFLGNITLDWYLRNIKITFCFLQWHAKYFIC